MEWFTVKKTRVVKIYDRFKIQILVYWLGIPICWVDYTEYDGCWDNSEEITKMFKSEKEANLLSHELIGTRYEHSVRLHLFLGVIIILCFLLYYYGCK